jgi:hypothetical protein
MFFVGFSVNYVGTDPNFGVDVELAADSSIVVL